MAALREARPGGCPTTHPRSLLLPCYCVDGSVLEPGGNLGAGSLRSAHPVSLTVALPARPAPARRRARMDVARRETNKKHVQGRLPLACPGAHVTHVIHRRIQPTKRPL